MELQVRYLNELDTTHMDSVIVFDITSEHFVIFHSFPHIIGLHNTYLA